MLRYSRACVNGRLL